MLINALLILLSEILLVFCGMAMLRLLQRLLPNLLPNIEELPLSLLAISGLIGSTFIAAIMALFVRIDWQVQLLFLLGILVYAWLDRHWIISRFRKPYYISLRLDMYLLVLFSLITALVLATSADPDRSYDDGLYHLQSVLLITQHGAIPGLGLLHNRFAYNAIWHITSALWGFQFLHPQKMVYFISAPVLMINFLLYLINRYRTEKNRYIQWMSLVLLTVSIFFMVYYRYDFGAVDNNLPSFILTWLAMLMFCQIVFRDEEGAQRSQESVLFLFITVFAWTVKISTLMLLLPAVYIFYQQWKKQARDSIKAAISALLLLVPWVIRSLITSGYFLYPPPTKWFGMPFKWQMPFAMAHENALVDISWAKIPGASTQDVSEMSLSQWIPQWFSLLDRNEILLIGAAILAIIFAAFTLLVKHKELIENGKFCPSLVFLIWMLASLLFWFFSYPDPRFFYGPAMPIVASAVLSFALWIPKRYRVTYPMLSRSSIFFTILVIGFLFVRLNILSEIKYSNIKIHPSAFPIVEIRHVPLNGFTLNLPVSGDQCWGNAVPCVPDKCSEAVHLRGDTLFDGFVFIEPTP